MISTSNMTPDPLAGDRLLIVGDGPVAPEILEDLKRRYPDWVFATAESYLAAIAELCARPARAVLAQVNGAMPQLDRAVACLRKACEDRTKLVLCCPTEFEPTARRVVQFGADDYVIFPFDGDQLDAAFGYVRRSTAKEFVSGSPPAASLEELALLADVVGAIDDRPMALLERIAPLLKRAMRACGVTVVMEGAVATAGEVANKPVLTASIQVGGDAAGQLCIGEPIDDAYTPGDVNKLSHYADLIGRILAAAAGQRRWRRLALTDECSGLPNRRYLHERLDQILARAEAERFSVTLLIFDVDDLKRYNDEFGHDAGDEIIRVTGRLFHEHCREQDIVARYGGDEFAVVFWDSDGPRVAGSTPLEGALAVLERCNEALRRQPFACLGPGGEGRLTISGGLATYPWDAGSREELFKRADEALLAAKRAGKNRIFLLGDAESQA